MYKRFYSFWKSLHIEKKKLLIGNLLIDREKLKISSFNSIKPNLILVGSQKSGTSSLHIYLQEHPDIFMSNPFKEPGYFIFDEWAKKYHVKKNKAYIKNKVTLKKKYMMRHGYAGQKYFGESSTFYTLDNFQEKYDIANRIKYESPHSKIIYLIRNPFERLLSAYYHQVKYWDYKGTVDELIINDENYLKTTQYYDQIKPYIECFGLNNVNILLFEDLINSPQQTMNHIFKFLEIPDFKINCFEVHHKTSPKYKVKYLETTYDLIYPLLNSDRKKLEEELKLNIQWEFSKDKWVD